MKEQLRIEGNKITYWSENSLGKLVKRRRCNLADFIEALNKNISNSQKTPLLPNNVCLYGKNGSREVAVVQESPRIRNLAIGNQKLSIQLPYVVYFLNFTNGQINDRYENRMFFRTKPSSSERDELLLPAIEHVNKNKHSIYSIGAFCANMLRFVVKKDQTFSEQINQTISFFWNSQFESRIVNHPWGSLHSFPTRADSRISTMESWAKASRENPLFVLEDKLWPSTGLNVGQVFQTMLGNEKEKITKAQDLVDLIQGL